MAFEYRGHDGGERVVVLLPLDSTSANITPGMAITASGATANYYKEVDASGEAIVGIAMSKVDSPSSDGGAHVKVDVSDRSVYEVGPDSGTVSESLRFKTMDVGADGQSVDIDASSTDDIYVHGIDTVNNKLLVTIRVAFAGVV